MFLKTISSLKNSVINQTKKIKKSLKKSSLPVTQAIKNYTSSVTQKILLNQQYSSQEKNLILFLIPNENRVSGGLISICSIYNESKELKTIHHSSVIMCTLFEQPVFTKLTKFKNNVTIFRFSQLFNYFISVESLLIHVPELYCYKFLKILEQLSEEQRQWLKNIKKLQINILNQNVKFMPKPDTIDKLRKFCDLLTCTTAHEKYSSQEYQEQINIPLHKLSTYVSPEQYYYKPYQEKKDILIISPDKHPRKDIILQKIKKLLPNLEIKIINNINYEDYKILISKAKWSLTFGEGLDGYFIELVFSGGIGFTVYNEDFFTEDFKNLPAAYKNYEDLEINLVQDIKRFDEKNIYQKNHQEQLKKLKNIYDYNLYKKNLRRFYQSYY